MKIRTRLTLVLALALIAAACAGETAAETTTTGGRRWCHDYHTARWAGGANAALASLQSSMAQSGEATKGRMEGMISITGNADSPGETFAMTFSGEFDNEAGNFSFIMDLSSMAAQFDEEIPPELADRFGEMEIRTIGDTSYIRFGLFTMFLGPDVEWVATSVEEGIDATGGFTGATPSNPADFLEFFEEANGTVEDLGEETIRGVKTTHFFVTFDMEDLLAKATPEQRAEIEAQQLPVDELPMDLWISDDGLIYKYVIEIDGSKLDVPAEDAFESMIIDFEMFDYGEDIVIAPPETFTEMEDLTFGPPGV